jgi:hypothetical protein
VAVLDEFSMAAHETPGVAVRPIVEPTSFKTYGVVNAEVSRSIFADELVELLKHEMHHAVATRGRRN